MKPYKIMSSKLPGPKKLVLIDKLPRPHVPLWFFKKTHTPAKALLAWPVSR